MSAWIDNTLDELEAHLRELKREVSRREWEVSWLEDNGLGRVHHLDALRRQSSRSTQSEGGYDSRGGRRVSAVPRAA
ncbi:MAG: hypothetical protein JO286_24195 [Solirubrobacterales bacterium]|nr:hypothetical protein [Solirubrobacterales bacterium]MBV9810299.1 hypothetical protein [Solirubrobacterales bacterium]